MAAKGESGGGSASLWRLAPWIAAACLLLLPLVAMQFTDEVDWDGPDFILFGAMLAAVCGAFELAARRTGDGAYRAAVGLAVVTAFVLVWVNLAVGIIGNGDDPANLMYGAVLAVGLVGAVTARFRPLGMARALFAMALAQALVAVIVLVVRPGDPAWTLTVGFMAPWLASAWLFRKSARTQAPADGMP